MDTELTASRRPASEAPCHSSTRLPSLGPFSTHPWEDWAGTADSQGSLLPGPPLHTPISAETTTPGPQRYTPKLTFLLPHPGYSGASLAGASDPLHSQETKAKRSGAQRSVFPSAHLLPGTASLKSPSHIVRCIHSTVIYGARLNAGDHGGPHPRSTCLHDVCQYSKIRATEASLDIS